MFGQRRSGCVGQTRDELSRRAFAPSEREPIIIEARKFHADQKAGLLDIKEAKLAPQR
jgi:hypothetical protein